MTDTTEVQAQPDGSFVMTESTTPVRVNKSGSWTAIDTTLAQQSDGQFGPKASPAAMEFSAGGTGPMAKVQSSLGQWVTVSSPSSSLPTPTVNGASATYQNVFPGVDLVLTDTAEGMKEVLRVNSASAAANSQLRSLAFNLSGATFASSGPGGAVAPGQVMVPEPGWWDSSSPGASVNGPGVSGGLC